ncbi:helix-turn-helix transcriptional regulator [Paraflavitalea sp. CAU 1676]|uniref:helix-turn-helix domain-containing protein n=1 Tax=Paraflavitalea sp. CAU 1676 TaxID=3032598 RepID=UPI0023DB6239|nr:helix-turn-helix transcriptional regulator [Paraflavitalea sp. CAU 1676]MDF2191256.1 helix-turn-helix transcriptional regulator [Paraflavitalea sp. CAU 1676]
MKHNAGSSLLTTNKLGDVTETNQHYLEAIKAFARLSYESIYVIDYKDMSFEYVSDNPLFLCGYSAAEVLQLGYEFYFRQVPAQDLELLSQLNEAGFDFYAQLPVNERTLYSITYDFHLTHKNGKQILINHKLTPLFLTPEGKMWKSMCIVSLSRQQAAGNVSIHRQGSNEVWDLVIGKKVWRKSVKPSLTERELEVLRMHAQGYSIDQIAEKLFVAPDTVKYYRRRIFERLEVSNVMDALSLAVASKLI